MKKPPVNINNILNDPKVIKWLWIIVAAPFGVLLLLLFLVAVGAFGKLPTFEELENPKNNLATEIYSEDGKMIGSFFVENRSYINYSDLNDSIVAALVCTEDARFYSHSGIDFISFARVGLKTVAMGRSDQGGGSTITQQLAKNLFRIRERVQEAEGGEAPGKGNLVIFKLKEWITAIRLEYNYTKEEIIAMYLNTVEFGSNAYGIKSAARTFFNKDAHELTINEAAMLVGVVNAPTRYSPRTNPERALVRRNTVLSRMRDGGFITRKELDSLKLIPIELDYHPISHTSGSGTYFREMLKKVMTARRPERSDFVNGPDYQQEWDYRQELERWETNPLYGWVYKNLKPDGTQYNIYRDGLKIYTTINSSMQRYAEEAVHSRLENEIQPRIDAQIRNTRQIFYNISKEEQNAIINAAVRQSDRYKALKKADATDAEIAREFDTPVQTRVFSYKGEIDTLITPRDSVIHHKKIMRASFMAMDPSNGHVKAYVGGPDYRYFKYDMVKQGKRQVGSTIKPFVYTFAIDHLGFTPCTRVQNVPTTIETDTGEAWTPKEAGNNPDIYDSEYKPLQWGLAMSRNNYSAWIMKQAKNPAAVADLIHRMGIMSYIYPVYALALGTPDFSLFEMVGSYGTYVNSGVFTDPIFVTRIEDRHGNLVSSFTSTTSDAISEQTSYTMLQMLQYVLRGTASRLRGTYGFTGEMGGKTGTSQENRDAWFMGVVPKLVAGAWVGGEDQSFHLRSGGEGSAIALPIYGEFMKRVYADPRLGISQSDKFRVPAGAVYYDCSKIEGIPEEELPEDEFFD